MTKKEICLSHETIATYSICAWLFIEIKKIEYGTNNSVYFVSHAGDEINYYKARIIDNGCDSEPYFMWGRINKVRLSECISTRM